MAYSAFKAVRSGWAVRKTGAKRSLRTGLKMPEAWSLAKRLAKAHGVAAKRFNAAGSVVERKIP